MRLRVVRRIVRRMGAIVLIALATLVFTGFLNVMFIGKISQLLAIKLLIVTVVIALAISSVREPGNARIWRATAPNPELAACKSASAWSGSPWEAWCC